MHMNSKKYDSFTKIFQKKRALCEGAMFECIWVFLLPFFFLNYTVQRRYSQDARTLSPMNTCTYVCTLTL